MAYTLSGTNIRNPLSVTESNGTQVAQQQTLSGAIGRDYFGSNKRVWELTYENTTPAAFTVINNIYQTYLSTATAVSWQISEAAYSVSATTVHIDLVQREFSVLGADYLASFSLILTES